jgi:hypothetical protein
MLSRGNRVSFVVRTDPNAMSFEVQMSNPYAPPDTFHERAPKQHSSVGILVFAFIVVLVSLMFRLQPSISYAAISGAGLLITAFLPRHHRRFFTYGWLTGLSAGFVGPYVGILFLFGPSDTYYTSDRNLALFVQTTQVAIPVCVLLGVAVGYWLARARKPATSNVES